MLTEYSSLYQTFQSTLPARGATRVIRPAFYASIISIHAPRTGSDVTTENAPEVADISIHAPRTGSDAFAFRWASR